LTKQAKLTAYLNKANLGIPRCYEQPLWFIPQYHESPSVDELVAKFLSDVEFTAIQLGTILGTPEGDVITSAVEAVLPSFYSEDVTLIVDALTLAAKAQTREQRTDALAVAAAGLFLLALVGGKLFPQRAR
jgi:hypothetical protein